MNVFIIGSVIDTAISLDRRRLNKQIIECQQILDALSGKKKAWDNHPCVLQYMGYEGWLDDYKRCLEGYAMGDTVRASVYSILADGIRPDWHTQEYYDQMKRRLYTKDSEHYNQWADLGESDENWYFVDGEWRKYVNGKRVE